LQESPVYFSITALLTTAIISSELKSQGNATGRTWWCDPVARSAGAPKAISRGGQVLYRLTRNIVLAALLSARVAAAQTVGLAPSSSSPAGAADLAWLPHGMQLAGRAPVGHRQPRPSEIPLESVDDIERGMKENLEVDRKLIICRGC
jgi:hypothetical protein